MRLSSTPDSLKTSLLQQIDTLKQTAGGEQNLNEHAQYLINHLDGTTQQVYKSVNTAVENVAYQNNAMQQACKNIATQERLNEAYTVCGDLLKDEVSFANRFSNTSDAPELVTKKMAALKQACNAVFCNPNDDNAMLINKEPVCFPRIANIEAEEIVEQSEAQKEEEELNKPPPVDSSTSIKYLSKAFLMGMYFIIGVLLFILFIIVAKIAWKHMKCIIMKILKRGYSCEHAAMFEEGRNMLKNSLDSKPANS
jgi:hypothetical protein